MKNTKAVIMAGGFGTRLRPLTEKIPKPMMPVVSTPCIDRIVLLLTENKIFDIAVTTMYKGEMIKNHLEKTFPEVNFIFENETEPLGTSGAVGRLKNFLDGDFLVISGDAVCDLDIKNAIRFHNEKKGMATVVLSSSKDPTSYGTVLTDDNDRVFRFIEKPDWSRVFSDSINTGIYIFSKEIFSYIPKNGFSDFSKDVFPKLLEKGEKIYAKKFDFYWKDIGSFSEYFEANFDMLKGIIKRNDNKENRISAFHNSRIIPPCFIDEDCVIENCEIGPNTVIGKGCRLTGAKISDSVLFENVSVKNGAYIRKSIICDNVKIEKNVSVGEESVIGSDTKIGEGSIVSSGTVIYNGISYGENSRISGRNFTLSKENRLKSGKIIFEKNDLFDVLRWGYAYGNTVSGNIAFAFPEKSYSVFAQTLSSGIRDSGDNIYILSSCDLPSLKYIVRNFGFDGGIYLRKEDEKYVLTFIDEDGLFISSDKASKMKKLYFERNFDFGKFGKLKVFNGFNIGCRHHFEHLFSGIRSLSFSVAAPSFIMSLLPENNKNSDERFIITDDRLYVFKTEDGVETEYSKTVVSLVCLYVFGKMKKTVFIPENFPSVAEKIARENGFTVRRISFFDEDRYLLFDFTDPLTSSSYLFKYLSENNKSFSDIVALLPEIFREETVFEIDGDDKAKIMSSLHKDGESYDGGVKFYLPAKKSIVSVISSSDKKGFRIYAESTRSETAKELCEFYVNKIKTASEKVKKDTSC